MSNIDYKAEAKKQWSHNPAGAVYSRHPRGSASFFEEVNRKRYEEHPWILELIKQTKPQGKKVLEIGVGLGADLVQFARAGGHVTGVDLTETNIEFTKQNFFHASLPVELHVADAEKLPLAVNTFDIIYSFGVLHHVPDTEQAVAEVYRTLKKGGTALIVLYHRRSIFFLTTCLSWLLRRTRSRVSFSDRMSRIEYSEVDAKPLVKVYNKRQARKLFQQFSSVHITIDHLNQGQIPIFNKPSIQRRVTLPISMLNFFGRFFGWYIIIHAKK